MTLTFNNTSKTNRGMDFSPKIFHFHVLIPEWLFIFWYSNILHSLDKQLERQTAPLLCKLSSTHNSWTLQTRILNDKQTCAAVPFWGKRSFNRYLKTLNPVWYYSCSRKAHMSTVNSDPRGPDPKVNTLSGAAETWSSQVWGGKHGADTSGYTWSDFTWRHLQPAGNHNGKLTTSVPIRFCSKQLQPRLCVWFHVHRRQTWSPVLVCLFLGSSFYGVRWVWWCKHTHTGTKEQNGHKTKAQRIYWLAEKDAVDDF